LPTAKKHKNSKLQKTEEARFERHQHFPIDLCLISQAIPSNLHLILIWQRLFCIVFDFILIFQHYIT